MTEKTEKEKPLTVELKPEDRELLKSVIEAAKPKPAEPQEHKHFAADINYLDAEDSCPECKKGLEAFGKAFITREKSRREKLPYVCVNCGTGVSEDEEECPTCGSKNARRR